MIKYIVWLIATIFSTILWVVYGAVEFPYADFQSPWVNIDPSSLKDQIWSAVTDTEWPIQQFIKLFLPNRTSTEWLLPYIQYIVNIALSLVAFIAVIVLIYWFYGIIFRDSQEGISNARKTVKWAAIAIVVMWASWLIVQFMFYIITLLQ